MNPRRVYWRGLEIARDPKSELYFPARRALAHLHPGLLDRLRFKRIAGGAIPPATLRYRVHGNDDLYNFLKTGRRCSRDILSALKKTGRTLESFHSVLDFGCGCGRTLVWLAGRRQTLDVHGTDIDGEAISWCQNKYVFGKFLVNEALPPLTYRDKTFDLIYAISVFTHINQEQQSLWLREFKRLLVDKGILLITLHGEHAWKNLPEGAIAELKTSGTVFVSDGVWKGIFPDWYQTTYHFKEYVLDTFSKYFKILHYIPRGMNRHQDVVVLQNEE